LQHFSDYYGFNRFWITFEFLNYLLLRHKEIS
jgi:hypothetical protein